MKLGLNTMVFCDCYTDNHLFLVEQAAQMGYELLEVVMGDASFHTKPLAERLHFYGMSASASCVITPAHSLANPAQSVRTNALAFYTHCFEMMKEFGASTLSGPLFSSAFLPLPRTLQARQEEWKIVAEGLHQVALLATQYGITLCIEPCNRYRTDLINTAAQAIQMVKDTCCNNIKLLYDTYHANIEENNVVEALRSIGKQHLGEIHACENHRGALGSGHIPFPAIFDALLEMDYSGAVIFESFVPFGKDNLWLPHAPTQHALAQSAGGGLATELISANLRTM